jgi:OOP family OmpA-OmpF porin
MSGAASADENPSGPYVGAGYGDFNTDIDSLKDVGDVIGNIDTNDGAYKVFFGWRLNPYISLEADYIDLGNPRGNFEGSGSSGDYRLELAGFAPYLIGTLPLGIFEFSGKVGYYFHDANVKIDLDNIGGGGGNVIETSDNGEAFVYGVGAGITIIDRINVKVEYEGMDIDRLKDTYLLWLTGEWRF